MRRQTLPPPRPARGVVPFPVAATRGGQSAVISDARADTAEGPGLDVDHETLAPPRRARPRLRRLFNPVTGWFRRLERRVNQGLGHHLYPWLPGMAWPYSAQLRRHLTVVEGEIALRHWPAGLNGLGVLLISDIHTGPFLKPTALGEAFQRLMALGPDLVVIGGDTVTGTVAEWERFADAFQILRAPLGLYAVMGNHDHYTLDVPRLTREMEASGVEVLHNRAVRLGREEATFHLAGIDDLHWGEPDLDSALAGTEPPVILLSHNPDVFFDAAARGVSLVLSGHTHGGQIRIPGLPVLVRMSRFRLDEGRYQRAGAELVVSRGLGATGLPVRFACPPEAVFLRLHRLEG